MVPDHTMSEVMEMKNSGQEKLSRKNSNEMYHGTTEKGKSESDS